MEQDLTPEQMTAQQQALELLARSGISLANSSGLPIPGWRTSYVTQLAPCVHLPSSAAPSRRVSDIVQILRCVMFRATSSIGVVWRPALMPVHSTDGKACLVLRVTAPLRTFSTTEAKGAAGLF
jgi:hypothetical protein